MGDFNVFNMENPSVPQRCPEEEDAPTLQEGTTGKHNEEVPLRPIVCSINLQLQCC